MLHLSSLLLSRFNQSLWRRCSSIGKAERRRKNEFNCVLRSRFYTGNYGGVLQEANQVVADSDSLRILRDSFVLRTQIAMEQCKKVDSYSNPPVAIRFLQLFSRLKQGQVANVASC